MPADYSLEYAKSGRSTCTACKEKIEKHDVRLLVEFESSGYEFKKFRHFQPGCLTSTVAGNLQSACGSVDGIGGYANLNKSDQQAVLAVYAIALADEAVKQHGKEAKAQEQERKRELREAHKQRMQQEQASKQQEKAAKTAAKQQERAAKQQEKAAKAVKEEEWAVNEEWAVKEEEAAHVAEPEGLRRSSRLRIKKAEARAAETAPAAKRRRYGAPGAGDMAAMAAAAVKIKAEA